MNNKINFTYLLGAGASANSVPVVDKFSDGLHDFCVDIDKYKSGDDQLTKLRVILEELKEIVKNTASFDTLAKALLLSDDMDRYYNYKHAISCYIFYKNLASIRDKRYDLFFASVLRKEDSKIMIPSNLNIISWNYDSLVEMSLSYLLSVHSNELYQRFNFYSN